MATLTISNLAPGRTAVLQLYDRGTNTTAGIAITGSSSGATYSFADVPAGDYDGLLSGFTSPNAARFPVRDSIAYQFIPWSVVDATITTPATLPDAITGLCNVLVAVVSASGTAKEGATVLASLTDKNNTTDGFLAANTVLSGTTDSDGYCTLTLIQRGQFTSGGGAYTIVVKDSDGLVTFKRTDIYVPNVASCNLEDIR